MRVYHDWEFLETGNSVYPISVGMVTETGEELYYEFADAPWDKIEQHPWLMDNVMPHLILNEYTYFDTTAIRDNVFNFFLDIRTSTSEDIELWGYYSAYDHVCLGQLFGRMIDLPEFVPMWTNDLMQEFHRLDYPSYLDKSESIHNALSDARDIRTMHEWLLAYESARL